MKTVIGPIDERAKSYYQMTTNSFHNYLYIGYSSPRPSFNAYNVVQIFYFYYDLYRLAQLQRIYKLMI